MRLLYIANVRLPTEKAHGLQIVKTAEALARAGAEVALVAPRRLNPIQEDPVVFYGVKRNFKMVRLPCIDLLRLPFLKVVWFWLQSGSFALSAAVFALLRRGSVLYTRDAAAAFLLACAARPFFYEMHTIPETGLSWHKRIWRKARGLIVISEGIKNELMRQGIAPSRILVARDAVDIAQFQISLSKEEARKKLGLPRDKKVVLYTGHLYDWKGANLLLQAAGKFQIPNSKFQTNSNNQNSKLQTEVLFLFVGGTDEDVRRFRKQTRGIRHVLIAGCKPHALIPLYLRAADLLVLPTSAKERIGAQYTSPLKLFEYMASGRPIVSADLPSHREVLTEDTAFFFKPDDADDLARVIHAALKDHALADRLSFNARTKASAFSWDNRATHILDFFDIVNV